MDLRQLRHVVVLAEAGNFSRAADAVSLTQPALSRSIATLESSLGLRLFDRGRRGVVPTAAGEALVREARLLLAQARGLEQLFTQWRDVEAGEIAFGAGPLIASLILPTLLTRLAEERPGLVAKVSIQDAATLLGQLHEDRISFCLTSAVLVPADPRLDTEIVGHYPLGLYVRKTHPLAGRESVMPADLHAFPVASGGTPASFTPEVAGYEAGFPAATIVCENFHILAELMLGTDAIWISSERLIERLAPDRAVMLRPEGLEPSRAMPVAAVRLRNRTASPAARLLLDWARALLA
jgi:DNA-binding transcriptional LysR family regulator